MARPVKQGIDYFPMDTTYDNGLELFISEFETEGFGLLVMTWGMLYKENGYYLDYNENTLLLLKRKSFLEVNRIEQILYGALKWKLFNNDLFAKYRILTSRGIQKRYFTASKRKTYMELFEEYLLETPPDYAIVNNVINNEVNVCNNPENVCNNDINKSKLNKTKENKPSSSSETITKPLLMKWNKFCEWTQEKHSFRKISKRTISVKTATDIKNFTNLEIAGVKYPTLEAALSACLKYLSSRPNLTRGGWLNFEFLFAVKNGKNGITKILEGTYDFHDEQKQAKTDGAAVKIEENLYWGTIGEPRICPDCLDWTVDHRQAKSISGVKNRYTCRFCKREFSIAEWEGLTAEETEQQAIARITARAEGER